MEAIYHISEEEYKPMVWFEEEVFSNTLDDFFAKRPVDYTKHDKSISASDLF
jgi:ribonucleoside-diphosphate reductase beta chain